MDKRKRLFRRQLRTVFLAIAATATFVWSAIDIFEADPAVLYDFLLMCLLGLALLMLSAGIIVFLLKLVRRK
jgi:hypothetical protein